MLEAGEGFELVDDNLESSTGGILSEGHTEHDGHKNDHQLQNIEDSEVHSSVFEDGVFLTKTSENADVDVEEGDG